MGLVAVVHPVPVPPQILIFDLWVMVAVTAMLLAFLLLRRGVSRPVGVMFLAGFVVYTALQYYGVEKILSADSDTQAVAEEPRPKN
jgi:cation:H+ antiporter